MDARCHSRYGTLTANANHCCLTAISAMWSPSLAMVTSPEKFSSGTKKKHKQTKNKVIHEKKKTF